MSGNVIYGIEIPTANLGFSTMTNLKKVPPSDYNKRSTTGNGNIVVSAPIVPFPVVGRYRNHLVRLFSSSTWSKKSDLPLEFRCYLHSAHANPEIAFRGTG